MWRGGLVVEVMKFDDHYSYSDYRADAHRFARQVGTDQPTPVQIKMRAFCNAMMGFGVPCGKTVLSPKPFRFSLGDRAKPLTHDDFGWGHLVQGRDFEVPEHQLQPANDALELRPQAGRLI